MNRNLLVAALGAAVLLSPAATSVAHAWSPIAGTQPVWCGAANYSLNQAGSADLGIDTTETEVRRGMDDWTRVACSGLRTNYTGRTSNGTASFDGNSVVRWLESSWGNSSVAIGVTSPQWSGRCITQADMEMNGVNYTWTTSPGSRGNVNAYSIILHEGGHYMGLGHSNDPDAAMYGAYSGGIDTIGPDDEAGICSLYPGMGVDCTTVPCPGGYECNSGTCEPIRGDGSLCSPCTSNSECGGPSDYCVTFPDGLNYCTTSCRSSGDCGGDSCFGTSSGGGVCAPADASGNPSCAGAAAPECTRNTDCDATERCNRDGECVLRPVDLADLGEPCASGEECNSGECIPTPEGSICSETCDWLDPMSCGAGFYCDGEALGACGDGRCVVGNPGAGGLGAACTADTQCDSLVCAEGLCALPCVPGGIDSCPESFECRTGALASCGTCQMVGAVGDSCETSEDCATRQCAERGAITFCTDFCVDAEDCPPGFSCAEAGSNLVCAPPADYVPPGSGGGRVRSGGCCSVAPGAAPPKREHWALLLLMPALIWLRRRRKG